MGKKTTVGKKKKGRPSLLELQKRKLLQESNPNPNPTSTSTRRSTRRNPNPEADRIEEESLEKQEAEQEEEDDDEESNGKRKEKNLNLVLKVSPRSSPPLVISTGGSDGEYDGSDASDGEAPLKKRRINAVGAGGLDRSEGGKADKYNSGPKVTDPLTGTAPGSGSAASLPDKKLLLVTLDRLQKKDTYGVFSEPVDPTELPDYHEVIKNPMDFSTVRNKLSSGAYEDLEQFEKDVFLISSNAMRYNAPDTIYFRQARSIQELAKKSFENLKQGREDTTPEVKTVRRGRPPGKSSISRSVGRPPSDRAGSDFTSDATLATAADNTHWSSSILDFSKNAVVSDKFSITDLSARTSHGSHNGESYNWLAEYRSDRIDEFSGSMLKGMSKLGKKHGVLDDNRRSTYMYSHQSASTHEPSILTVFNAERKQLMPVGFHMEHTYARSLARFAAHLGPVAWKIALKKIEKVLPAGMKFGPGWVGEVEESQPRLPLRLTSPLLPTSLQPPQLPPLQTKIMLEPKGEQISERQEPSKDPTLGAQSSRIFPPSASTSTSALNRSSDPTEGTQTITGTNGGSGHSLLSNVGGAPPPSPHFQLNQNPAIYSTLNGFRGFNLPSQVGKLVGPVKPPLNFGLEALVPHGIINMASRSNKSSIHPTPMNHVQPEHSKLSGSSISINSAGLLPETHEGHQTCSRVGQHAQATWRGQPSHPKQDSVPPDLNVGFQSAGSPASSGALVDSQQPDLALQL